MTLHWQILLFSPIHAETIRLPSLIILRYYLNKRLFLHILSYSISSLPPLLIFRSHVKLSSTHFSHTLLHLAHHLYLDQFSIRHALLTSDTKLSLYTIIISQFIMPFISLSANELPPESPLTSQITQYVWNP